MYKMHRLFSMMAVVSGGGTAGLTMAELIPMVTSAIGALCAIITATAAVYYMRKNYLLNLAKVSGGTRDDSRNNESIE